MKNTLSIIIPCHNRPDYVAELAESLPDEDGVEIIFVDDHSLMPVFPARSFERAEVRYLVQDETAKGVSAARNRGIEEARGEWIIFCDDDDLVDAPALVMAIEALDEASDVVYCAPTSFNEQGGEGFRHRAYAWLTKKMLDGELECSWRFHSPCSKILRTSFLKSNGVRFPLVVVSEDAIFNATLLAAGARVKALPMVFYHIREGHVSVSTTISKTRFEQKFTGLMTYNDILRRSAKAYLMAPAGKMLLLSLRRYPFFAIKQALRLIINRHPLFLSRWTLLNALKRYFY